MRHYEPKWDKTKILMKNENKALQTKVRQYKLNLSWKTKKMVLWTKSKAKQTQCTMKKPRWGKTN